MPIRLAANHQARASAAVRGVVRAAVPVRKAIGHPAHRVSRVKMAIRPAPKVVNGVRRPASRGRVVRVVRVRRGSVRISLATRQVT